jgi:putative PIN family toxin of toxin-antitoxin system
MKVLFDTNVFVSEALVGGLAEKIIEAVINARWRVFASAYLLDEVQHTLHVKLRFPTRLATLARQRARQRCEPVEAPPSRHRVLSDPKDGPILAAAVAAGVDYLVSDDRHLRQMHPYEGIKILSMREFAELLRNEGMLS